MSDNEKVLNLSNLRFYHEQALNTFAAKDEVIPQIDNNGNLQYYYTDDDILYPNSTCQYVFRINTEISTSFGFYSKDTDNAAIDYVSMSKNNVKSRLDDSGNYNNIFGNSSGNIILSSDSFTSFQGKKLVLTNVVFTQPIKFILKGIAANGQATKQIILWIK